MSGRGEAADRDSGEAGRANGGVASPGGEPAPAPRPASEPTPTQTCERCGHDMYDRHCKVICPNCGYQRDCSDP